MEKQRGQALPWPSGPGVFHGNVHRSRPSSGPLHCPAGLLHVSKSHHAVRPPTPSPVCVLERPREASPWAVLSPWESGPQSHPDAAPCTGGPGHLLGVSWNSGRGDSWVWVSSLGKRT